MAPSWIIDECRQQAVLHLAAGSLLVGSSIAGAASGCPSPLLMKDSPLARAVESGLPASGLEGTVSAAKIAAWVDRLFREHETMTDAGVPVALWTRAELVEWWLRAGQALSAIDVQHRVAVARATQGAHDVPHPAIWCAERFTRFHLDLGAFKQRAETDDWKASPSIPGEYRKRLFLWVMSPDRPRPGLTRDNDPPAWLSCLQAEMRNIREDAVSLFGPAFRFRTGGELSLQTIDKWIARWSDLRIGGQVLNEVRRPVVYPSGEGTKHLVKGVVVLQRPQALVADPGMVTGGAAEQSGNMPALMRATAFARARWQPNELLSSLWGKAAKGESCDISAEAVEHALLAVARWLSSAQIVAEIDESVALPGQQGELIEATRVALALDGFRIRESRGGQPAARAIPYASGVADGFPSFTLACDASSLEMVVGCLDEPASCPADLFAAIEAVDWRLWAYRVAPWNSAEEKVSRIIDLLREQVLRGDEWESIKRQALHASGSRRDEQPLATLYGFAHHRRLALELFRAEVYGGNPSDSMIDGLISEFGELARQSLVALVAIAPSALGRLEPPRQRDGSIDVPAWLTRGGPPVAEDAEAPAIPHRLRWCRSSRPPRELVEERRVGPVVEAVISAGDASEIEMALLNAPLPAPGGGRQCGDERMGGLTELLAGFQAKLVGPQLAGTPRSVPDAISSLRAAFAGDAAPAFHELIARCRKGDAAAKAWCRLMQTESDFQFACHPAVDLESGIVQPASPEEEYLAWEFDATVQPGNDLAVRFSMTPANARRVISLGAHRSGSLADRTELLAAACRQAGGAFVRFGEEIRQASYRWLTFGADAAHPVVAARLLLEELLRDRVAPPDRRTAIFTAAADWCEGLDHALMPSGWRADGRLLPSAFADLALAPEFDEQAATGAVAVRCFGLQGVHGWPFSVAVSAGPAPAGFREFRAILEPLGNAQEVGHTPPYGELVRRADELARHALAGTMSLALPNLFDRVWELIASEGEAASRVDLEAAAARLFEMLKFACRMIPFEPSKIGEYSAGWVREADGTQPRGRRIKRVVRPGLRTVENVLVRPALVITE
jgi:hypothetical protein